MKHLSLFVLAYLFTGDMAASTDLAANCVTTHVLPVITTTTCSASSSAVPTASTPNGKATIPTVPEHHSQPAVAPSAAEPSSVPDTAILDKPMHNPTTQNSGAGINSALNPPISGQSGSIIGHVSSLIKPTDSAFEPSNTPVVVSGASTTGINTRVDMMIMTGLLVCLAPVMIHL
ncbi:uncharacterized protein B0J16DRAFT_379553 [Fusarium flagelliforme]|uniref:uncharacterized protein n=1 Tax=Fusarium flagelliforme TaxID=2675880 RepID=UPI001E8D6E4D|nr:uncharacterized protein B0J16DRAFT_379553 [Fusarium flagelliforme]KAH7199109.1 hypothetical protein B0J16DRAFT_379553 [Fusarium flagelliforme]